MTHLLLSAILLTTPPSVKPQKRDSSYEKVEHWIDTSMPGYDDDYDREVSKSFLRQKTIVIDLNPTFYQSPFKRRFEDA